MWLLMTSYYWQENLKKKKKKKKKKMLIPLWYNFSFYMLTIPIDKFLEPPTGD